MNGILSRDERGGPGRPGAAGCPFVARVHRAESTAEPGYDLAVGSHRDQHTVERINCLQIHSGADEISTIRSHHGSPLMHRP